MNLKTAAARLSIHYQTAYKLVRSGSLAAVKIGGSYEISEAALERYRAYRDALLREAAAIAPSSAPLAGPKDRRAAIDEVRTVAESSTTSAAGVIETIVWVGAAVVGDVCTVRARTDDGFNIVAFHDLDPRRRAAVGAIVDGHGFGDAGPTGAATKVRASRQSLLVRHVRQDLLRASIDPVYRQFLDVVGSHSLVVAPVVVDGVVEATVTLNRAAPGAPYDEDDVAFAEAMAACLAHALRRSAAYREGWDRRRALVHRVEGRLRRDEPFSADGLLDDGRFAEIISNDDGAVALNDAAARLTGGEPSLLVDAIAARSASDGDRLERGDLEYHDEEHDLELRSGGTRRVIVHRGLVRDDGDRQRVLVVVAQDAPVP
jgi:excisionase family DNA binding protein